MKGLWYTSNFRFDYKHIQNQFTNFGNDNLQMSMYDVYQSVERLHRKAMELIDFTMNTTSYIQKKACE